MEVCSTGGLYCIVPEAYIAGLTLKGRVVSLWKSGTDSLASCRMDCEGDSECAS